MRALVALAAALAPGGFARADAGFSIGQNFQAIDRGQIVSLFNGNFTRTPAPDVNGGVGPDHVVLFIKGVFQVYDKRTGAKVLQRNDVDFWNTSFTNAGLSYQTTQTLGPTDPRIIFDPPSQRWYAVGIDRTSTSNGLLNIGVSDSANPAGTWRGFTYVPAPGVGWPDFPTVGINERGLFVSAPIFSAFGALRPSVISYFPREHLTAPIPSPAGAISEVIPGFISNPVVALQPHSANLPVIRPGGSGGGGAAESTFTAESVGGVPYVHYAAPGGSSLVNVPQPNGSNITVGDARVSASVVMVNNEIWAASPAGQDVQWYRLNATTGALLEQGIISSPERYLYYPSIAVNAVGEVVIGMNASSSDEFVSAYAVAGRIENGVTRFGELTRLAAGHDTYMLFDSQGRNRWGDYSTTVADPTDPHTFWTFQEIVAPDRFDAGLNQFIDNNRAIQITQILVPEPAHLATASMFMMGVFSRRRRNAP